MDAADRERLLEKLRRRRLSPEPRTLDLEKAILGALHSARLSGTDPGILEKMAEDAGIPWRNPDDK